MAPPPTLHHSPEEARLIPFPSCRTSSSAKTLPLPVVAPVALCLFLQCARFQCSFGNSGEPSCEPETPYPLLSFRQANSQHWWFGRTQREQFKIGKATEDNTMTGQKQQTVEAAAITTFRSQHSLACLIALKIVWETFHLSLCLQLTAKGVGVSLRYLFCEVWIFLAALQ